MIAGHCEHEVVLQTDWPLRRVQVDVVRQDFQHRAAKIGRDVSILNAILDIGQDPILHMIVHFCSAMHQSHAGAVSPQIQSSESGGILAAYDQDVGDRKSTRLNSSHVAISYAVFCLKKKKKKNNTM